MFYIVMIGIGYIISLIAYKISVNRKFRRNRIKYRHHNSHSVDIKRSYYNTFNKTRSQKTMEYNTQLSHQQQIQDSDRMMQYMMWQNMNNMEN